MRMYVVNFAVSPPCTGRYSAHVFRQEADVKIFMEDESLILDPQMDYDQVTGLSSEVREKLFKVRPTTIVSPVVLLA